MCGSSGVWLAVLLFIYTYYSMERMVNAMKKKLLNVKRTPYKTIQKNSAMNCANCSSGNCNGGGGGTSCGGGGGH